MPDQDTGFSAVEPASSMPGWYPELLGSVSRHISIGRRRAVRAANQELVLTYWQVGREILERQTYEGYGTQVVNRLSADLKHAFPESTGFSPRNLRYMRALAAAWPEVEIVQRSAAQLPWRHHQHVLDKLEDTDSRLWYAAQAVEQGWSRDVLAWQIETRLRERSGKAITNFDTALPPEQSDLAQQATKDPYLFDFLGTTEPVLERDLERKLLEHVSEFLLELGQGFALVGRQVPLTLGGDEFWCDLLFYHLRLRRYVVVELKAGAVKAEFVGQLGMYLAAVTTCSLATTRSRRSGCCSARPRTRSWPSTIRGYAAPIGVAEWAAAMQGRLPHRPGRRPALHRDAQSRALAPRRGWSGPLSIEASTRRWPPYLTP